MRTPEEEKLVSWSRYTDSLEQEIETIRNQTIEECALLVESAVAAIRALKDKP